MGCKLEGSTTNLFAAAGASFCFSYCRIRMISAHARTTEACRKVEHNSASSENRQLLCNPSNYFWILAFCISRQASQAQRSSFSVLKARMLQKRYCENDCWVSVTITSAMIMKEELFINIVWGQLQVQLQPYTCEALPGDASLQTAHATAVWLSAKPPNWE